MQMCERMFKKPRNACTCSPKIRLCASPGYIRPNRGENLLPTPSAPPREPRALASPHMLGRRDSTLRFECTRGARILLRRNDSEREGRLPRPGSSADPEPDIVRFGGTRRGHSGRGRPYHPTSLKVAKCNRPPLPLRAFTHVRHHCWGTGHTARAPPMARRANATGAKAGFERFVFVSSASCCIPPACDSVCASLAA